MSYIEVKENRVFFDCESLRYCNKMVSSELVFQSKVELKKEKRLTKLILLVSNSCNLCCSYCFADKGAYTINKQPFPFKEEILRESLKKIYSLYPEGIRYVELFGGEPLVNFNMIQKSVQILEQICEEKQVQVPGYSMVTNGTLLNQDIVHYLNENSFFVTVSLDGNIETHDKSRHDFGNNGTYARIQSNLKKYPIKYLYIELSIFSTMIENYKQGFVKDCLIEYIGMGCQGLLSNVIVDEHMEVSYQAKREEYTLLFQEYIDFMVSELFEEDGKVFDFTFVNIVLAILQHKPMRPTCTQGVQSLTMGMDGKLVPCYLSDKNLGNALDIIELKNKEYTSFTRPAECKECWCHLLCQCWCREENAGKVYTPRCDFNKLAVKKIMKSIYTYHKQGKLQCLISKLKKLQDIQTH